MAQYKGIAYPFRKGSTSFPARAEDAELIADSILQIMGTQRGERVMRPEFGANVVRFVFANNNEFLEGIIGTEVQSALGRFEPRIIVQQVRAQREETTITVTIDYIIRATGVTQTLEFKNSIPR